MPDMGYDAAGLYEAASQHGAVSAVADEVVSALAGLAVPAGVFGGVAAAGGFAAGVDAVREHHGRAAFAEALARRDLGESVRSAAAMGADLTTRSTSVAASVPGSISAGMLG